MYYEFHYDERIKGKAYSDEPERLEVGADGEFIFNGWNNRHHLTRCINGWECDCSFYSQFVAYLEDIKNAPYAHRDQTPFCSHTFAAERIEENLSEQKEEAKSFIGLKLYLFSRNLNNSDKVAGWSHFTHAHAQSFILGSA